MSRRGNFKKVEVEADSVYKNVLVAKLVNRSMHDGKKSVAQKEIYRALEIIKEKGDDPLKIFSTAIDNIKPEMEVKPRRIGGAVYQVPSVVRGERKESLAIRWLVSCARTKSNTEFHTFGEKLAVEIMDAAKGEGLAIKKKTEMEKMAEANKAFAHFKW
ncbi:30S ribosomal protein S7 [Candidatus Woesebacteria bacterium RIFOXYA1_FULL_43_9]|uniref:Small ribosomal subunit protein uS7 n=1 Tax=Candidatus Woesebacteria bacterium RIFOXYA1_FULL_43_9 TaxID=1802534 RepID=A0A1F8CNL2_9BACT|nr:MAG: 30S ribosomal protein S7 [Candidatus Woesebacteria bacterium RIFOXYA1_FULL_43_9]